MSTAPLNSGRPNKALVTLACGHFFEQLGTITHPTLAAYGKKVGADFIVWRDFAGHAMPHYKKLDLGKLLDVYDRVLYVDTDLVIRDDAPDVFDLVPPDALGILDESPYYERGASMWAYLASCGFPPEQWDGHYYNTGVMVLSQAHRELFVHPTVQRDHFKEQSYLNLRIAETKTKIFSLPYRFNRQLAMDAFYGEDRLDSYFLHYAGLTIDDAELPGRMLIVATDLERWRRSKPAYRFQRHLLFVVEGDRDEQLAAEPVVRHAVEVQYPNDDVVIVSSFPDIFWNLGVPLFARVEDLVEVGEFGKYRVHYTREQPIA